MKPSTAEAREFAADAVRQAEHVARDASRLRAVATEAVEAGVRAPKRAIPPGLHDLGDLPASAA